MHFSRAFNSIVVREVREDWLSAPHSRGAGLSYLVVSGVIVPGIYRRGEQKDIEAYTVHQTALQRQVTGSNLIFHTQARSFLPQRTPCIIFAVRV